VADDAVLVLGHTGFFGGAIFSRLKTQGRDAYGASKSTGIDLRDKSSLSNYIKGKGIKTIINCAAVVGGIEYGRQFPATIFHDNLSMLTNILEVSAANTVTLVNPISNCAYPKHLEVYSEPDFWDGPPDDSVLVYGMVRRMTLIGAAAFENQHGLRSKNLVFPNIFGPGDHLDPMRAHAFGALVFRFTMAKINNEEEVLIWGTGKPVREWMFIDDAVDAIVSALDSNVGSEMINVGTGFGISIKELAEMIATELGYSGNIQFDNTMQDGVLHKVMDGTSGHKKLNWYSRIDFVSALRETINWYEFEIKKLLVKEY
jgi:GDP-L-fucose synthase